MDRGHGDLSEAHCRKIAQRTRIRIDANGDTIDAPSLAHAELLDQFVDAIEAHDPEALTEVLGENGRHVTDGGEVKEAAKRPLQGLDRVTRFYPHIAADADDIPIRPVRVNGRPGFLAVEDGTVHRVWAFRVADEQIRAVDTVMAPDKLPARSEQKWG